MSARFKELQSSSQQLRIVHDLNDVEAHWPGALRCLTDWLRMQLNCKICKQVAALHSCGQQLSSFPCLSPVALLYTKSLRYKTAEGKNENKFGFAGKPQSAEFAKQVVVARLRMRKLAAFRLLVEGVPSMACRN